MDAALQLRKDIDEGQDFSIEQALKRLDQSLLVQQLTSIIVEKRLFYTWRLIALSEIPFAQHLSYTQDLIARIYSKMSTDNGFSMSGDDRMF